jgi:hypothetical protein
MERDTPREAAIALVVGAAALLWPGGPAAGQDRGDLDRPLLLLDPSFPENPPERTFLPPFLRDTALALRLRSYYADVHPVSGFEREAWAFGGWLAYRSGWLLDALQVGATFHASVPVYAPEDKGDTLLLAPGKEGYHVLGEAFAALRYRGYALLRLYRLSVDEPYINRQDNAMTPNTFEGVTLEGSVGPVDYVAGYLARIKGRNADEFVSMSEAAGASGSDRGVAMVGVKAKPLQGLEVEIAEQYGVDTFNTFFARVEHVRLPWRDARLQLGGQLTDQRAVGAALLATTGTKEWATQNVSARVAVTYRDLTLKAGGSVTASGNRIQNPWGFFPGPLRLTQLLFDNAGEKAWLLGLAYDFSKVIVPGLSAWTDLAWGVGSIDPVTRARLPDEAEYDLVVTYAPPRIRGLRFRFRGVLLEQQGADRLGFQVRFIVNWEIPLSRGAAGAAPSGGPGPRSADRSEAARGAGPR